jgi:aspartate 4-decarboxylase
LAAGGLRADRLRRPAAEEWGIVLLDGGGFDAPTMSVRVSLANLPDDAYEPIGRGIVGLLADYDARWQSR